MHIRLGWKTGAENDDYGYVPHSELKFSGTAVNGHLPMRVGLYYDREYDSGFIRSYLGLRTVTCNL
jgi:hypothetical protein